MSYLLWIADNSMIAYWPVSCAASGFSEYKPQPSLMAIPVISFRNWKLTPSRHTSLQQQRVSVLSKFHQIVFATSATPHLWFTTLLLPPWIKHRHAMHARIIIFFILGGGGGGWITWNIISDVYIPTTGKKSINAVKNENGIGIAARDLCGCSFRE